MHHRTSSLTRMAQQHHHENLSQYTSQYSGSSDETQCHDPEPKHNSKTASQCVTKHHDQHNQWNKQHQLRSSSTIQQKNLTYQKWSTQAYIRNPKTVYSAWATCKTSRHVGWHLLTWRSGLGASCAVHIGHARANRQKPQHVRPMEVLSQGSELQLTNRYCAPRGPSRVTAPATRSTLLFLMLRMERIALLVLLCHSSE